jgi:hypothetical protein
MQQELAREQRFSNDACMALLKGVSLLRDATDALERDIKTAFEERGMAVSRVLGNSAPYVTTVDQSDIDPLDYERREMAALAEDYMITIHNYVMFNKENEEIEAKASTMFKVGDKVKNVNAVCKHYGSEGIVKEIRDLPEDMGYAVVYECTNDGATWKKGDMIGKTEIQLKKIKASEDDYDMEEDEDYKGMMTTEGQKFNDFLKQCIPNKQGDDKSKFKSCLEDYRKNK